MTCPICGRGYVWFRNGRARFLACIAHNPILREQVGR